MSISKFIRILRWDYLYVAGNVLSKIRETLVQKILPALLALSSKQSAQVSGAFTPLETHPKQEKKTKKKQAIVKGNIQSAIPITGVGTQRPSKPWKLVVYVNTDTICSRLKELSAGTSAGQQSNGGAGQQSKVMVGSYTDASTSTVASSLAQQ